VIDFARDRSPDPAPTAWEDRTPPQDGRAEMAVLGSMVMDNACIDDVLMEVEGQDFYLPSRQIWFDSIARLHSEGRPCDAVSLCDAMTRWGAYDQAGGDESLCSIMSAVPHAAHAIHYARIVRQHAVARELIVAASEILRESYGRQHTAEELVELAESRLYAISEDRATADTVPVFAATEAAWVRIVDRDGGMYSGLTTGLPDLDALTDGFQPGQLVVLAARPSLGKTAMALNFAEHVALTLGKGVLIVSLEMAAIELGERFLAGRARVDGERLKDPGGLTAAERIRLGTARGEFGTAPIFIDDSPARNMVQVAANARRHRARHDIGLLIVDYIQLIEPEDARGRSRQEQVAQVSRRLKCLAKELNIPILALSQLNRLAEAREDKRPRLADLRESGSIEQDADTVILLHRPEFYSAADQPGVAEAIVAKNRSGSTGTVKTTFLKSIMRFEPFAPPVPAGDPEF
jgi:replicative DNA helicase